MGGEVSARLIVATPFDGGDLHTARVTLGYLHFRETLIRELGADTLRGTTLFACDVVRARNRAAATVLRDFPEITHVLWLDDDNFPEDMGHGVQTVRAMIDTGEHLIAAPYVRKSRPHGWVHQGVTEPPDERGVATARGVGFGFTLTTRECLQQVSDACAQTGSAYYDLPNNNLVANVFGQVYDAAPDGRKFLASEDLSFCVRWRALGGRVAVYAGAVSIVHAGSRPYTSRDLRGAVR